MPVLPSPIQPLHTFFRCGVALYLTAVLTLFPGCGGREPASEEETGSMDRIAESYVKLVLSVGRLDPDYVDAYYCARNTRGRKCRPSISCSEMPSTTSRFRTT